MYVLSLKIENIDFTGCKRLTYVGKCRCLFCFSRYSSLNGPISNHTTNKIDSVFLLFLSKQGQAHFTNDIDNSFRGFFASLVDSYFNNSLIASYF